MKKLLSLTLALGLTASVALAAPEGWTPAMGARGDTPAGEEGIMPIAEVVDAPLAEKYTATVTLNGVELDLSAIPGAPIGYIPMRALCEAEPDGMAEWYQEDNQGSFNLDGHSIIADFATGAVQVNFETQEGITYFLRDGVTFIHCDVLAALDGISVNTNPELSVERYDVTTTNGLPLTKLAREIRDAVAEGAVMKNKSSELGEYYGLTSDLFEEVTGFSPMMINSQTVIIGKPAEGKLEDAKKQLEQRKADIIQSFEGYLPDPYEMAKNGEVVTEGDYVMLIISDDNAKGIEMFKAGVANLK